MAHPPLHALESAAAARPDDPALWAAAFARFRDGLVSDDDVGSCTLTSPQRPRVAVVTPYFEEEIATLRRCHESVLAQSYACRHIMVADGRPRAELDAWDVDHVRLPTPHGDYGDTPRAAGGAHALALGYDAVAYLDADNSWRPHHVKSMVCRLQATGADIVFSGRTLHFPDGTFLPELDPADGRSHVDTSCMCLAGDLEASVGVWVAYPRLLSSIGDRLALRILRGRGKRIACTGALTVRYTMNFAWIYEALGMPVPPGARAKFDPSPVADYCRGLSATQWQELRTSLGPLAESFLRDVLAQHAADR